MGDYDDSGSNDDYSNHYEDGDESSNQVQNYVQRRKKNPFKDLFGAASGEGDCCAHVVSPYVFLATLAGLAIATYFIRQAITMKLGKRRKRSLIRDGFYLSRGPMLILAGKRNSLQAAIPLVKATYGLSLNTLLLGSLHGSVLFQHPLRSSAILSA